jgi:hypothetical protein
MRGKHIAAAVGFWIIELRIDGNSIISCKSEFFPTYK